MKRAVLVLTGTVLAGTILTIVMGQEPGFLLGLFLILGSVAATATVRRGGAHKFIPLPALAYLVAATLTGMAHDSGSLNSSRQFVLDFLTWIGGSFVAVTASTILVVLIALTRWLLSGRLVSGQLPASAPARTPARPASRESRGNRDARGRHDEGTWPSQGMRDGRSTWDRGPGGDPRDWRPREQRPPQQRPQPQGDGRGRYDDQDPRDDRRSPSGPRDLW